jgi:hypothetical protein
MLQRLAVQKLHGDEQLLAAIADFVLADLIDGADVGMVQGRCGARLATKPFQGLKFALEQSRGTVVRVSFARVCWRSCDRLRLRRLRR